MEDIKVSVIIPAYNCEKYIVKAIESVLSQRVNTEIVVIEDCSKDNTYEVLLDFKRRTAFPEGKVFKLIKNPKNMGVAESRNRGVREASGEYIAFLDADDWWEDDKLSLQLFLIEEKKAVLCSSGRELMRADGSSTGKVIPVKEELTYQELLKHNAINCSSVILKRDVALEFPMGNDELHEDYITWLKILKKYKKAVAVNKPLLKYRLSEGGKSRNKLKSARMTFGVYRAIGCSRIKAIRYFCSYALYGLSKYI